MRVVGTIKRKKGSDYIVNKFGEIVEITQAISIVGKIKVRDGHEYYVDSNGNVIELRVVNLTQKEYDEMKRSGELLKLVKQRVKINIVPDEEATLSKMEEIDAKSIEAAVIGAKIVEVGIRRNRDGSREFFLSLDNGREIKLKEGLLLKGAAVEVV